MISTFPTSSCIIGLLCLAPSLEAQVEVHHYDGTTESFSRFGINGSVYAPQTWYARLPGDQIGAATGVISTTVALLDVNGSTTETIRFRLFAGDSAPAHRPGALIAESALLTVSGPGVGSFFLVSFDWTGGTGVPVPLPGSPDCRVPDNDLYVAVQNVSGGSAVPFDGLFIGSSFGTPGEQFNPNVPSDYINSAGAFRGLTFVRNDANGTLATLGGNLAFFIRTGLSNDVLQPFAANPGRFTGPSSAGDGQNPNYGYAGIWPDGPAGDQLGVRLGSQLPPGGVALLFISPATQPGVPLGGLGVFCLAPPLLFLGTRPLLAPGGSTHSPPADDFSLLALLATSEAIFGPYVIPAGLAPGLRVRMQAGAISGGSRSLGTMATTAFP